MFNSLIPCPPSPPIAAAMFQKLSKILTILTDPVARASYDRWQRAKHAARRRHEELSAKRKKLKEELESRESQRPSSEPTEREAAAKMQKEVSVCLSTGLPARLPACLPACLFISYHEPLSPCPDRAAEGGDAEEDSGAGGAAEAADGQRR